MLRSSRRRTCYECKRIIRRGDPVTWSRQHKGRARHAPYCPDRIPVDAKEGAALEAFLNGTLSRIVEREVKRQLELQSGRLRNRTPL